MGYGSQHDLVLNVDKWDSAKFNGRKLILTPKVESWDFTHPMDGMTGIKPDMLKIKFYSIELTSEDLAWLKKQGVKKGDYLNYHWEKNPEGGVWSGYTRSEIQKSMPMECRGKIEIDYIGEVEVVAKVTYSNLKEIKGFIYDVLDYIPDEKEIEKYSKINDVSAYDSLISLHDLKREQNSIKYGYRVKL